MTEIIYTYTNTQYSRTRRASLHFHIRPKDGPPEDVAYPSKSRARRMGLKGYKGRLFFLVECTALCEVVWETEDYAL